MKAWLVRANAGENNVKNFLDHNIVGIGWSRTGDLTGKRREDIENILKGVPYNMQGYSLGSARSSIDLFLNKIAPGDLVLIPDENNIHIGRVTGDYSYDPGLSDTPHVRKVEWLKKVDRGDMSMDLRSSLKAPRTVGDFTKHAKEIEMLSKGEVYEPHDTNDSTIDLSYPLRPDFMVNLKIPSDISKGEAERLAAYFGTLYFA